MYPDPILRAKNKRVVTFDENLKKTDGIGLSAPQVGINVQLMVFNPAGERGEGEEIVLVNPRVVKSSKKLVPFTEGCLSFPGINADVVGTLFFDRMTAEVVDSIRAELLALEQKYEDRTGLSRPESIETRKRWKAATGFGRS
ncbi:hypothetical protein QVD17_36636 [Tagetes erecta]|uniref:Peptide deformylase n=1 Tax=Tagetes erecta TaxID=13708 RepID=A0AAD8NJC9_TARER|nr:hypothetical protein QVD17_36636 [Tagetes erecta]